MLLLIAAASFPACASSAEEDARLTPTEWLQRNTVLLENLRSYEEPKRIDAINTFKGLGKERGTQIALALLLDPKLDDYRIEIVVARILADWQDRRALRWLVEALKSPDAGAIRIAKEGLEVFRDDPEVCDVLIERLKDAPLGERRATADVLARMNCGRSVEVFGERYLQEPDAEVRGYFLLAIESSRHSRREEFLVQALLDRDESLRVYAWNAVAKLEGLPEDIRFDPRGPDASRIDAVARLRLWRQEIAKEKN
jgi:HEAT repeat protein